MSENKNLENSTALASTASGCYVSPSPEPLDFGFYNIDCMEGMVKFPDNYFDLAIVDPPYGIKRDEGFEGFEGFGGFGKPIERKKYKGGWDNKKPTKAYFDELLRVAKLIMCFGGNFFTDKLPQANHWLFWDKLNTMPSFGDGELIWTNFNRVSVKKITVEYNGLIGKENKRIHATQKPILLYRWLLHKYAKIGWKILDTHVGSGSSLIACEWEGFDYVGFEIDADYYQAAVKRIENWRKSRTLDLFKSET